MIRGNLNAVRYQQLEVASVVVPLVRANISLQFIQHTAQGKIQLLRQNKVQVLSLPSNSPDLTPIENMWIELERHVRFFSDCSTNATKTSGCDHRRVGQHSTQAHTTLQSLYESKMPGCHSSNGCHKAYLLLFNDRKNNIPVFYNR